MLYVNNTSITLKKKKSAFPSQASWTYSMCVYEERSGHLSFQSNMSYQFLLLSDIDFMLRPKGEGEISGK